jgi:hypothetical protein
MHSKIIANFGEYKNMVTMPLPSLRQLNVF